MKKKLLTILTSFTIITTSVVAQPTLLSTNINPVTGDILSLQSFNYVNAGGSGANQTWNFSAITQTSNAAISYTYGALSAANSSIFVNANQQFNAPNVAGFNKVSTTALQTYGQQTGTINIVYSDPEDVLRYPFTMNNTYVDPFNATFSSGGSNYVRRGKTTVTADGYGTIQFTSGTFSNVLRVHFVQDYQDSTTISGIGSYVIKYLNDEYMWYLPNNHAQIFSTYSLTVTDPFSGSSATTGANKLVSVISGVNEQANSIKSLNFYPNPTSNGILNLDLNLSENIKFEIAIYDNLGREVLRTEKMEGVSGYNFRTINLSNISAGLYNLEVISNNIKLTTKKVLVN